MRSRVSCNAPSFAHEKQPAYLTQIQKARRYSVSRSDRRGLWHYWDVPGDVCREV